MGKIQLVVEIDDKYYTDIKESEHCGNYSVLYALDAIRNGTPLPKGHGNLVDFDSLCEEYWDGNYMEIHKDDLSNIKPIIEADKEG